MTKIEKEKQLVKYMIEFYCRHKEKNNQLCDKCRALIDYAHARLDHCKFGNSKSSCKRCPIHCYKSNMREQMRAVMRYSGPRMIFHAPLTTIKHWFE